MSIHLLLLRAVRAALWLPAAAFWLFAAWRSRVATAIENERAGIEQQPRKAKTSGEPAP